MKASKSHNTSCKLAALIATAMLLASPVMAQDSTPNSNLGETSTGYSGVTPGNGTAADDLSYSGALEDFRTTDDGSYDNTSEIPGSVEIDQMNRLDQLESDGSTNLSDYDPNDLDPGSEGINPSHENQNMLLFLIGLMAVLAVIGYVYYFQRSRQAGSPY